MNRVEKEIPFGKDRRGQSQEMPKIGLNGLLSPLAHKSQRSETTTSSQM